MTPTPRINPTTGRGIDRRIAALAIPALVTLLADPLYDLCDTAILGHLGTRQLAGAAIAMRILGLSYSSFIFLLFSTTASVARLTGAGRRSEAATEAVAAMWLGLALGIATALVVAVTGRTMIGVMGGHGQVAQYAWTYLSVSLLGFPAFMLVMAGTAYRRGNGDTRLPMLVALITVAANLAIEITLIYGLGYGVGASALGTVVAKWLSALAYLALVGRSASRMGAALRPSIARIRRLLAVGGDLIVRTIALQLQVVAATALAARHGPTNLAAFSIAFQVWMFSAFVSDGLEVAGHTLVGGELGRDDPTMARRVARRILVWSSFLGIFVAVIVLAVRGALPRLFSEDDSVVAATATALIWVGFLQPVNAVAFALDGILVGAGDQRFLARAMIVALGIFAAAAAIGDRTMSGLAAVFVAIAVFMVVRSAAGLMRLRGTRWIRLGVT